MPTIKAHAKINWFLRVTGKRADGYHDIESLFQTIGLRDILTFEMADSLSIVTEAPIPSDDNLVMKAALMIREVSGVNMGARIGLIKNIPIAAGLGGGSSDAAATLKGLNELWGLALPHEKLHEMAMALGSDVPFFLDGPSARAGGRGERISRESIGNSVTLLLLKPSLGVSAGWAYSQLADYSGEETGYTDKFVSALKAGDFGELKKLAVNDLEAPVFREHPEVGELKDDLYANGALFAAMSGSGPTVFGVFERLKHAHRAESAIGARWSAVVETRTDAS
jgi:4-diphosphocytidyl-2-C-methyl-D-erythritol kinase